MTLAESVLNLRQMLLDIYENEGIGRSDYHALDVMMRVISIQISGEAPSLVNAKPAAIETRLSTLELGLAKLIESQGITRQLEIFQNPPGPYSWSRIPASRPAKPS